MTTKFFFLLFSTLLLAQCVLANSSEENKRGSSEEKVDEEHLIRHVSKLFIKLVDETITATRRNFETVINDVKTNKVQTNPKVHEKLSELETLLDRATKTTTNTNVNEERRNKRRTLKDLGRICNELRRVEEETKTPTDGDQAVRRAHDNAGNEFNENLKTFVDRAIRDVERDVDTLPAAEQKERRNVGETLTEVKDATTIKKKLELLDRIFIFNKDT